MSNQETHSDTVLVVDDSATNRTLLRAMLQARGFAVQECINARECLDYCAKTTPAMILLDIMMPEISGLEACRELRRTHSRADLPIIMVSTLSEADDVTQGIQIGANDYVQKPIDRQVLMARIDSHLALSRTQKELLLQKQAVEHALLLQSSLGNALPEAVLVHDDQGQITYSNQQLKAVCSGGQVSTVTDVMRKIYGGGFAAVLLDKLHTCMSDWQTSIECDFEEACNGSRYIVVVSRPVPLGNGRVERLWLWRDETETKQLQQRVNQQIKLDTVGLFAAGIAHNFNNLLGGILGAVELLARFTGDNPRATRCINVIKRAVEAGTRLTRKMGAITRRQAHACGSCDFQEVLENATSSYRTLMEGRIKFFLDVPDQLPMVHLADIQLLEVFGCVIANAVESIEGEGEITVFVDWRPGTSILYMRVRDSGCGMTPETLSRLYEPFFSSKKLDKASSVSVEGRGLGLWNTYNLLKLNGGEIKIESEFGKGTEVHIQIPCEIRIAT